MSLSHGILGFLTYGEMSGYDLTKAFSASVDFFWHAQKSHIYLELTKLEKAGFITQQTIQQVGRPNKKLYSITETGKEAFFQWLTEPPKDLQQGNKNAFLMKVFFSGNTPPETSLLLLHQFVEDCQGYLNQYQAIPKSIESYSQSVEPYKALYWQFTADFGQQYMEFCIRWAKGCIEKLEALK